MKVGLAVVCFMLCGMTLFSQNNPRPLEDLINRADPAWPLVQEWIDSAKNPVEILPKDNARASKALYQTQVTTRSPMGAIIYSTGGLLVDHGWIRILGSGSDRMNRSLPGWNQGKTIDSAGDRPSFLLIADDAAGGFFALNGGFFSEDQGKVYYLSPDRLLWESLKMTYTEFLHFCFSGDLDKFYRGLRWNNWQQEVSVLDGNQVYNFHPFLWTAEGRDINKVSRKPIPVEEQYRFNMDTIDKQKTP
jgi:hypothetical protein